MCCSMNCEQLSCMSSSVTIKRLVTASHGVQLVEADNAWLKRSESHHRAIKMSLVRQHCPLLISRFEQLQSDKAKKKSQVSKKKAASKVTHCVKTSMRAAAHSLPIRDLQALLPRHQKMLSCCHSWPAGTVMHVCLCPVLAPTASVPPWLLITGLKGMFQQQA